MIDALYSNFNQLSQFYKKKLSKNQTTQLILVLTSPRHSSTSLCDYMDSKSHIQNKHELFHPSVHHKDPPLQVITNRIDNCPTPIFSFKL